MFGEVFFLGGREGCFFGGGREGVGGKREEVFFFGWRGLFWVRGVLGRGGEGVREGGLEGVFRRRERGGVLCILRGGRGGGGGVQGRGGIVRPNVTDFEI